MRGSLVSMMGSVILGVVTSEKEFVFFSIHSLENSGEMGSSSVVMMSGVLGQIVMGEMAEMGDSLVGMMGSVILSGISSEKEEFIFFSIHSLNNSGELSGVVGRMSLVLSGISSPEEEFIVFFSIHSLNNSGEMGEMRDLMSFVLQVLGMVSNVMSSVSQIMVSGDEDRDSVDGLGGVGMVSLDKEFIFFSIHSLENSGELFSVVGRMGLVLSGISSPEEEFIVFFSIHSLNNSGELSGVVGRMSLVLSGISSPEEEFIVVFSIHSLNNSGEMGEMRDLMSFVLQVLGMVSNNVMSFVSQIMVSGDEDRDSVNGLGGVGMVSLDKEFIFFSISSNGVVSSSVEMGESRLNSRLVGQIVMGEMGEDSLVEMGNVMGSSVMGQVVSRAMNGSEAELFSLNESDGAKSEKAEDNSKSHA